MPFYKVRKAGIRARYPAHTLHLVDFWSSEEDYKSGQVPIHTEDFETQWNGPHLDPGSRLQRIIDQYIANGLKGGSVLHDEHWGQEPDTHGILNHPSMERFRGTP
jgi:hypothetical protein